MEETNNSVVIVGAGNVATHIARHLHNEGFRIEQVFSRTEAKAKTLANTVCARPISDLRLIDKSADFYIISVKDDAIAEVLPSLACVRGLVLHTSGSVGIDVFNNKQISRYGVLYPLQTFSIKRKISFSEIPLFVEGNNDTVLEEVMCFAQYFSDHITYTTSEQRRQIHLAAVFANNFSNHMFVLAGEVLKKAGVPFDVLFPIINETAQKVTKMPPIDAQTGPAVRYDKTVMNKHLSLLDNLKNKEIYVKISENIHTFAEKKKQ